MIGTIINAASQLGASTVTGYAIKAVTPRNLKTIEKVLVAVGSFAVAGVIGSKAGDHMEERYNEITELFKKAEKVKADK